MRFAVIAVVAAAVLGGGVLQAQTANPPVTLATIAARNSGVGEAPVMLARAASPVNLITGSGSLASWRIWTPTGGSGWAIRDTTTRFLRFGYHATEATPRWFVQMHATNAAALSSDFEVVLFQTSAPGTLYRFPLTGSSYGSTPVANSQLSATAENVSASEKTALDGIPSSGGAWRFWLVDTTPSSGAIDWGRSGGAAWVRPPIGVSGLTVAARTNGLRVSWTAPTVTGGVDGFVVSVTPSGGSATDHVVTGSATSVDISNLTAGTSHSVTIRAHYDLSPSPSGRVSGPVSAAQTGTPTAPAPTVSTVALTSSPASGNTYERGENIEATVTFSSAVTVTGTPQIGLTVGSSTRQAGYVSGSGSTALVFRYTVVQADADSDGVSIGSNALGLNSGTIRSGSTNATLTHSAVAAHATGHRVDGSLPAPTISTVAFTSTPASGNTYERAENIEVTVTFSASVTVTTTGGTPRVALTVGAATRQADYNRGSGTAALVFRYTVVQADTDSDGVSIAANALALNGGTIRSGSTTNATITHSQVAAATGHRVNGALPVQPPSVSTVAITSAPGSGNAYRRGEDIEITVTFSSAVTVTGMPRVALTVGVNTRQAGYVRGSGSASLVFRYRVVQSDADSDGVSIASNALALNGGTLRGAGMDATITHSSVAAASGHQVDGSLSLPQGPDPVPPGPQPSQVTGVRVSPLDGGLRVSWSAATGSVAQYRVDVADAAGALVRRVYAEANVLEAVVDGLANGVEYTVTVAALPAHGGEAGPPSESRTTTPQAGAGDPDGGGGGGPGEVPVPALPLAGAGVLAGLLASAAYRLRRPGRRASSGGPTSPRI